MDLCWETEERKSNEPTSSCGSVRQVSKIGTGDVTCSHSVLLLPVVLRSWRCFPDSSVHYSNVPVSTKSNVLIPWIPAGRIDTSILTQSDVFTVANHRTVHVKWQRHTSEVGMQLPEHQGSLLNYIHVFMYVCSKTVARGRFHPASSRSHRGKITTDNTDEKTMFHWKKLQFFSLLCKGRRKASFPKQQQQQQH